MNQYFHVAFTQRNKVSHLNYDTLLRGDEIIYLARFSGCQKFNIISFNSWKKINYFQRPQGLWIQG